MLLPTDDYAKNAMSVLRFNIAADQSLISNDLIYRTVDNMRTVFDTTRALSSSDRSLHLTHLCVGPYNTQLDQHGKAKSILSGQESS